MVEGTITSVVAERGFGFIKAQGYQNEVFFHAKSLVGLVFGEHLTEMRVRAEILGTPKGPRAERVEAVE